MKNFTPYILLLLVVACITGCNDEYKFTNDPNARISFSADTVAFDTVFTTIGSSTKSFVVYNANKDGLRLPSIRLGSNGANGFRLNVDGQYGKSFENVEILGNDSIFVFVEVTVNPQDSDSPILVRDSILFDLPNGKRQQVILEAYGQDIIILQAETLDESTCHFNAERPYVIMDSLVVPEGVTMTAEPGTTICFHKGAGLAVHGTLNLQGTTEKPIVLRGDRTDKMFTYLPYDRLDGQWEGIHLYSESCGNTLQDVDIHGGTYGVVCDSTGIEKDKIQILNSSIHNISTYCLQSVCNRIIVANSQLTNAGVNCVNILGGENEFHHVTIGQFYPWHQFDYALSISNTLGDMLYPLYSLKLYNSIITGYDEDVIIGSRFVAEDGSIDEEAPFGLALYNCLVRTDTVGSSQYFVDCVVEHTDSAFCSEGNFKLIDTDNYKYDFSLDSLSMARGIGNAEYSKLYANDKNGVARKKEHPDAGCYEY